MVLTSSILFTLSFISQPVAGATLYVGGAGSGNYTTIQSAVDVAVDGDTIYVYSGTYYENITISKAPLLEHIPKSLNLIGEDKSTTIIDGGGLEGIKVGSGFWDPNEAINITGFTITNSSIGIQPNDAAMNIYDNIIVNNDAGIAPPIFADSTIKSIKNNNISNNNLGIIIDTTLGFKIENNEFYNNSQAIYIIEGGSGVYNNTFVGPKDHIYLSNAGGNISNNKFISTDEIGMAIYGNEHSARMYQNELINCGIDANTAADNGETTYWLKNWLIDISNTVNGKPIYFLNQKTNYTVPVGAGMIMLFKCDNITIKNQNISKTGFGIKTWDSSNITIVDNNISDNLNGIYLWSSEVIVKNNKISGHDKGIICKAGNSKIYHNNFYNNTNHTFDYDLTGAFIADEVGTNSWNLSKPYGGNYYDNWTTPDSDLDGFVDAPFAIYASYNVPFKYDYLPLTEPFVDFDGDEISDPIDSDDDNDGWNDTLEITVGTDPQNDTDYPDDFDADGNPDIIDPDDDNDGWNDTIEILAGTNPFDDTSAPVDSDGDGIPDGDPSNSQAWMDLDDDNDGVLDVNDTFPLDPLESSDMDSDSIGDNSDLDIDGDGVMNVDDPFPLDGTETLDSDGDGIGNNEDTDDDNDGVLDIDDENPLVPDNVEEDEPTIEEPEKKDNDLWWLLLVIMLIAIPNLILYISHKKSEARSKKQEEEKDPEEPEDS